MFFLINVSIVIPVYNVEKYLKQCLESVVNQTLDKIEVICINDGSTDHTSEICHKSGYEIIDLPINLGLAGTFQTGLKYAYLKNYDYAMQMDADGQHLPEYIEALIKKINEGYDIVIGSRFVTEKKPKSMRMLGSNMISWAIHMTTGVRVMDPTSGMRIFNRNMIKEFASNINYGPEPDTISFLLKQGAKIGEVQVKMAERIAGESYLNFTKSIWYMTKMLISIIVLQNFRKRKYEVEIINSEEVER